MSNNKNLLIIEKSNHILESSYSDINGKKEYILEGVFAVLDIVNENKRKYTADQYLPQLEMLQPYISASKVLGELNHPVDRFDNDLNNVSHVVEKITYDKNTGIISGRIRLLDTPCGRIAKSLVEDRIPLHISSRAAGSVNADGTVKINQLFTYDLVGRPGFKEAQLNRVNEKYGFSNNDDICLYEVNSDDIKNNFEKPKNDFEKNQNSFNIYNKKVDSMNDNYILKEDFQKYTEYLKETISELNEKLNEKSNINKTDKILFNKFKTLESKYNKLVKFTNYLSEHLNKSIAHSDSIVENTMQVKTYIDYLTANLDKTIGYNKYMTEKLDRTITFTNYLSEQINNGTNYSNYLAENLNKTDEEIYKNRLYTEYVANESDKGLQYSEHIAEKADQGIQYTNHLQEKLNESINYQNYLTENINNAISFSDYLSGTLNQTIYPQNKPLEISNDNNYNASITEKLDYIINNAKIQKSIVAENDINFLKFLDEDRVSHFNSLNENLKNQVKKAFTEKSFYNTRDAIAIFESVLKPKCEKIEIIEKMKPHYKSLWEKLTPERQKTILEQSKNYNLDTQSKIDNFWDITDLRTEKVEMEKLNENLNQVQVDPYMVQLEQEMMRRMGKI